MVGNKVPLHEYEKAKKIEKVTNKAIDVVGGIALFAVVVGVLWGVVFLVSLLLPIPWLFWAVVIVLSAVTIFGTLAAINEHYTNIRVKGDQYGTVDE